ncbi:MAG: hypothetical protein IJ222_03325 [Bacteroidales bacterium]|nr:hypothetical protein [Bacteroidales bacterium]
MKTLTKEDKLTFQLAVAVVVILAGIILLFIGFYAPPTGEIHNSVLIAYGESLTFAGALIGVDYAAKKEVAKFKEEIKSESDHGTVN